MLMYRTTRRWRPVTDSETQAGRLSQYDEYDLLMGDPPWSYDDETTSPSREIENHYQTMDLDDIRALDVPAADDSVLFLWATAPKLQEAISVLEAWGFEYRTCMVWDKVDMGLGHWARIQHELLLIGRRGKFPTPANGRKPESVFREKKREHSQKPRKARRMIERAYPEASKVELFGRESIEGWDVWGNEVPETTQSRLAPVGRSSEPVGSEQ